MSRRTITVLLKQSSTAYIASGTCFAVARGTSSNFIDHTGDCASVRHVAQSRQNPSYNTPYFNA